MPLHQINNKKLCCIFLSMCYNVFYHLAKLEPNTTLVEGEITKDILYEGVNNQVT